MKIELELSDVTVRTPAVAVVGTWDPVVDAHRELFQRLASRGKRIKCVPVVIVLFPPPTRFLNPDGLCLEYTDIKSRVALIQECARVKVLAIRFQRQDLDSSCRAFFDLVRTRVSLRELAGSDSISRQRAAGFGPSDLCFGSKTKHRTSSDGRVSPQSRWTKGTSPLGGG
jgi:FAD synthase